MLGRCRNRFFAETIYKHTKLRQHNDNIDVQQKNTIRKAERIRFNTTRAAAARSGVQAAAAARSGMQAAAAAFRAMTVILRNHTRDATGGGEEGHKQFLPRRPSEVFARKFLLDGFFPRSPPTRRRARRVVQSLPGRKTAEIMDN